MATATNRPGVILELNTDEAEALLGVLWLIDEAPRIDELGDIQDALESLGVDRYAYELARVHSADSASVCLADR